MSGTAATGFEPATPDSTPQLPALPACWDALSLSATQRCRGDLVILPGRVEHAEALAAALRPADRAECEALVGRENVLACLRESYEHSLWSWTACEPAGPVVAAWGVRPLSVLGSRGLAWCLTGEAVARHWRTFARGSVFWRDAALDDFAHLEGWVDARHEASVRWLNWLGFRLDEPVPVGRGAMFRRFSAWRP